MSENNSNNNAPVQVDPNTDDLVEFEQLFQGKAIPKTEETVKEQDGTTTEEPAPETEEQEPSEDSDEELVEDDSEDTTKFKIKPKKKSAKERIDELTAARYQAEREKDEALAEIARLKAEQTKPREETTPTDTSAPNPDALDANGEPVYPLGQYDPQYLDDRLRWAMDKQMEEFKASEAERRAQEENERAARALQAEWAEKVAEAETRIPDLREKGMALETAFQNIDPAYGEYLVTTIMSLENGPEVLYYLADNLGEARQIVEAGPRNATIALGGINQLLKASKEPKAKAKVSKAPEPPITPTRGTGGKFEAPADTDDLAAFEALFYKR